ncbi:transcription elongation factor TFIIS [Magnolia sinica]|uniref:transcription elongation factor TFIIS n=1 Tax=Magnolia sinica TaxID=86752 RepID=UPI00265A3A17|nr:transcription elongation factor TFIIS [Magnolia sinica]
MDKELLEIFEAAKKAADAAASSDGASSSGGGSEEARCLDALKRLRDFPVTLQVLLSTQVGKSLRPLTKHPRQKIQAVASDLFEYWKNIVIEETAKNKRKGNSDGKQSTKVEVKSERAGPATGETVKVEKLQNSAAMNIDKISRSENVRVEKVNRGETIKTEKVSRSETVKVEKVENGETVKVEKIGGAETFRGEKFHSEEKHPAGARKPSSAPIGPPKLTSMIKCNDSVRDKLRELLAEAFSKVSSEVDKDTVEEVNVCDPIRVAVSVESVMFEKLGRSNGAQKFKYRSIMFNLKDANNPDLRRKVLLGQIKPERLINMTPEEMASDKRKNENKQIKDKALFDCERGGPPKATTDQFKCGRCGQRKTTYYQLQTRSADEPMTTFVTCVNCNNHWKFC